MKLTKKQQNFADKYIETLNATQSAIYAGYSKKTATVIGHENLMKPYIKEYIDKQMKIKDQSRIMSQEEVLEGLTNMARNSEDEKIKIKAYELMGKRYATFTDKTINHNINENDKVDKLIQSIDRLRND